MDSMKDERWLKKIKERLDDYSEELPSGGWERLEQALERGNVSERRKSPVLVPWHRWAAAAAVILLAGMSAMWLLDSPLGDEVRQAQIPTESVRPDVYPQSPQVEERLAVSSPAKPHGKVAQAVTPAESHPVVPYQAEPETTMSAVEAEEKEVEESGVETEVVEKQPQVAVEPKEKKPQRKKKTSLEEPQPLFAEAEPSAKGWSFGLSVGNRAGSSDGNGSNLFSMSDAVIGNSLGGSNLNLSATADKVIIIPTGQSLTFKNGTPHVTSYATEPVSARHRQPVSVGFSVRKELGKGFSVESGLMYTLLSSELTFSEEMVADQKLHYLGIPLRANWSFLDTRLFTLYVSAGGAVEKCVYGKLEGGDLDSRPWQFSVLGSVGAQYNLSRRVGIYVEPGVSYYFDDNSSLQTIRKEHPCSFTLQAGFRLTY